MKIGIFTPTCSRPYMIRCAALQFANQTLKPNIVCFHQNGKNNQKNYEHFVKDIQLNYHWIHTPSEVSVDERYSIPLKYLIDQDCDYYFYCDDDDVYYNYHVQDTVRIMKDTGCDLIIRNVCDTMKFKYEQESVWDYSIDEYFTSHADIGVSSSVAFNRQFAEKFYQDCLENSKKMREGKDYIYHADNIIHNVTARSFKTIVVNNKSMCYVIHKGSSTSNSWV